MNREIASDAELVKFWEKNRTGVPEEHSLHRLINSSSLPTLRDVGIRFFRNTESGEVVTQYVVDKSRRLFSESPYGARSAAQRQLDEELTEDASSLTFLVVIGVASGHFLLECSRRIKPETLLIVIEPNEETLRAFFFCGSFNEVISRPKTIWLFGQEPNTCADAITSLIDPVTVKLWKILHPASSEDFYPNFLIDFLSRLKSGTTTQKLGFLTGLTQGEKFFSNSILNISNSINSLTVSSAKGLWLGRPGVLVAAGPSLEKQLPILRSIQDEVLLVCVGPAWKTLRAADVKPHFVVSIDPFDPNWTHFEGLQADGEILLTDFCNNVRIIETFEGIRMFCHSGDDRDELSEFFTRTKYGSLGTGGSVAHTAFNFLRHIGASPIILVGQDLAYTGGISHARGHTGRSTLSEDKAQRPDKFRSVLAYGGVGTVETNEQMDVYRLWYERLQDKTGVINCTEGGARIQGIPEAELLDTIESVERVSKKELLRFSTLTPVFTPSEAECALNRIRAFCEELSNLKTDAMEASKLLGRVQRLWSESGGSRDLAEAKMTFNAQAKKIESIESKVDLVMTSFLRIETFSHRRASVLSDDDESSKLLNNVMLYEKIPEACDRAIKLFELAQDDIKERVGAIRTNPSHTSQS
ncbi:6-hydroxymethylpterin diphosphokinase MptE-like [Burkholderiales bacterium]